MYLPSLATPAWLMAASAGKRASSRHWLVARSSTWTRLVTGSRPVPTVNPPTAYSLLPTCTTPASVRGIGARGPLDCHVTLGVLWLGVELVLTTRKLRVVEPAIDPVALALEWAVTTSVCVPTDGVHGA